MEPVRIRGMSLYIQPSPSKSGRRCLVVLACLEDGTPLKDEAYASLRDMLEQARNIWGATPMGFVLEAGRTDTEVTVSAQVLGAVAQQWALTLTPTQRKNFALG